MSTDPQDAQHLSEDQTLRVAAGGEPTGEETSHLGRCESCRGEIGATRRVVDALSEPAEILDPPAGLWERIEQETGPEAAGTTDPPAVQRSPWPRSRRGSRPGTARPAAPARRRGRLAAAAAAGVLVGAVAGAVGFGLATSGQDDGNGGAPAVEQIGTTTLDPVAAESMSGQARLERDAAGRLLLAVDVSELPEDGYLEVWLRDAEATRLVSLGVLDTTTGTLQVPQGIDLADYPVVDVSQEDFDGDPTHGGQTLVAGALPRT